MKRLSRKQRQKMLLRLKTLFRQRRKVCIINRRLRLIKRGSVFSNKAGTVSVCAPERFDIFDNSSKEALMLFFVRLREAVKCGKQKVVIDFSKTKMFVACGTLLFYAELNRIIMMTGGRVAFRMRPPRSRREDAVLSQLGFYGMCGSDRVVRSSADNIVGWKVAHGRKVDTNKCAPAIERIEGRLPEQLINGIFRGVGEAMTNTIHHAYIEGRHDGLKYDQSIRDWWMFSRESNGKLFVVFCDLGIGIRRSLPRKKSHIYRVLERLGLANSDADAIKYAMEDAVTRTGTPGRGRGLGDILQAVDASKNGRVDVISNKGCYIKKAGHPARAYNCKYDILGTLVMWSVPIDGVKSYGE